MLFTKAAIISITTAALGVQAIPLAAEAEKFVVLKREMLIGGSLTVYGFQTTPNDKRASTLQARQGSCAPSGVPCNNSHVPNPNTCNALISAMASQGDRVLGESPRAICLAQGGDECCVSWSEEVQNLTQGDLAPAATSALYTCVGHGQSGRVTNVAKHGSCFTTCLSDRPNGCS